MASVLIRPYPRKKLHSRDPIQHLSRVYRLDLHRVILAFPPVQIVDLWVTCLGVRAAQSGRDESDDGANHTGHPMSVGVEYLPRGPFASLVLLGCSSSVLSSH